MSNTAANPTDNTSTPTGAPPLTNVSGPNQQFVVWSPDTWPARNTLTPWNTYLSDIPAIGQNIA